MIGGGPAGTWAACAAAAKGARVILVDKGFCGTSGPTAAGGVTIWYVPPAPEARERAMNSRDALGGHIANRSWMARVLDETYRRIPDLDKVQFPFPVDDNGEKQRYHLHGPEYMRLMRKRVIQAGTKVLDHSPALGLLLDRDGVVVGAHGLRRQSGGNWEVRAGAVIIATGGCAFRSGALGCNVNTGDGQLMAVEAGAELSGMEFSSCYGLAREGCTVTKNAFFVFATFVKEDGTELTNAASPYVGRDILAKALIEGPVYARLDQVSKEQQEWIRLTQPNFVLPFNRLDLNPFEDWFPVALVLEGTVRGTGGLRLADENCATTVPGLFVAGDAASRELISGGYSGGGSHNSAWAISSGTWAGRAAASHAARRGGATDGSIRRTVYARASSSALPCERESFREIVKAVQSEVIPLDKNYFRSGEGLRRSLRNLDRSWADMRDAFKTPPCDLLRARETTAMVATARWMYRSALAREESRGMHRRIDFPHRLPGNEGRCSVRSGGLDAPWAAFSGSDLNHQEELVP